VRNIGFDDSGENCYDDATYTNQNVVREINVLPIVKTYNQEFRKQMIKFYGRDKSTPVINRIKTKVKNLFKETKPRWHRIKEGPAIGKRLFVAKDAFHGWKQMINGEFDSFWYEKLKIENLSPSTILDIGSHFGYHSMALKSVYPDARLISIEPNPVNIDRLKLHIEKNNLTSIDIEKIALSDKIGTSEFNISENVESSQSTGSYLEAVTPPLSQEHYKSFQSINIQTTTLDNLCQVKDLKPDLIKMDVEGAEVLTIKGGYETLKMFKPILCIEAHSNEIAEQLIADLSIIYTIEELNRNEDRSFLYCKPQ
jgi:FkbM family methyltransferase